MHKLGGEFVTEQGETMNYLQRQIQDGAKSFLATEYKYLAAFVFVVAVALGVLFTVFDDDDATTPQGADKSPGVRMAACFIAGAMLSAVAGASPSPRANKMQPSDHPTNQPTTPPWLACCRRSVNGPAQPH
jgi:Na+/H+-translocating membrane pyrophosphatase